MVLDREEIMERLEQLVPRLSECGNYGWMHMTDYVYQIFPDPRRGFNGPTFRTFKMDLSSSTAPHVVFSQR